MPSDRATVVQKKIKKKKKHINDTLLHQLKSMYKSTSESSPLQMFYCFIVKLLWVIPKEKSPWWLSLGLEATDRVEQLTNISFVHLLKNLLKQIEYALCFCPALTRRHAAIPSSSSRFCWNEHFCFQTSWQHPNPSHVLCSGRIINKMVISGFKGRKNITPIPCLLQIIAFTLTQHKICAVAHSAEDIIYCLGGVSVFALMSTLGNTTGVIL